MVRRVHLRVDGGDFAFLIDKITNAHYVTGPSITASTISQSNPAVDITKQLEGEAVLRSKDSIQGDIVKGNTKNLYPSAFESSVLIAKPATFPGSASCVCSGIEPQ
jgi:hypothetical protein